MTVHDCYRLGFGEPVAVSASTGEGMVDLYGALQPFIDAAAKARASRGVFLPPVVVQRPELQQQQQRRSFDYVAAATGAASGESGVPAGASSRRAAAEATEAGRSGQSGQGRSASGSAAGWADGLEEASCTTSGGGGGGGGPVSLHPTMGRAPAGEFDGRGGLVREDEAEEEGEEVASDDEASEATDEEEGEEGMLDGTQDVPDIIRMAILGQPNVVSGETEGSAPPLGTQSPLWLHPIPPMFGRGGDRVSHPLIPLSHCPCPLRRASQRCSTAS